MNEKMVSSQEQEVYKNVQEREFPYSTLVPGSLINLPACNSPSSLAQRGGKMRDSGNETVAQSRFHDLRISRQN